MRQHLTLPLLILYVGALVTVIHEYLYARIEDQPEYLLGLISHGGADMVVGSLVSALAVFVYEMRGRTR